MRHGGRTKSKSNQGTLHNVGLNTSNRLARCELNGDALFTAKGCKTAASSHHFTHHSSLLHHSSHISHLLFCIIALFDMSYSTRHCKCMSSIHWMARSTTHGSSHGSRLAASSRAGSKALSRSRHALLPGSACTSRRASTRCSKVGLKALCSTREWGGGICKSHALSRPTGLPCPVPGRGLQVRDNVAPHSPQIDRRSSVPAAETLSLMQLWPNAPLCSKAARGHAPSARRSRAGRATASCGSPAGGGSRGSAAAGG